MTKTAEALVFLNAAKQALVQEGCHPSTIDRVDELISELKAGRIAPDTAQDMVVKIGEGSEDFPTQRGRQRLH